MMNNLNSILLVLFTLCFSCSLWSQDLLFEIPGKEAGAEHSINALKQNYDPESKVILNLAGRVDRKDRIVFTNVEGETLGEIILNLTGFEKIIDFKFDLSKNTFRMICSDEEYKRKYFEGDLNTQKSKDKLISYAKYKQKRIRVYLGDEGFSELYFYPKKKIFYIDKHVDDQVENIPLDYNGYPIWEIKFNYKFLENISQQKYFLYDPMSFNSLGAYVSKNNWILGPYFGEKDEDGEPQQYFLNFDPINNNLNSFKTNVKGEENYLKSQFEFSDRLIFVFAVYNSKVMLKAQEIETGRVKYYKEFYKEEELNRFFTPRTTDSSIYVPVSQRHIADKRNEGKHLLRLFKRKDITFSLREIKDKYYLSFKLLDHYEGNAGFGQNGVTIGAAVSKYSLNEHYEIFLDSNFQVSNPERSAFENLRVYVEKNKITNYVSQVLLEDGIVLFYYDEESYSYKCRVFKM
ncbi:MAG: hypothetical protein ACPG6V_06520 [Flavobacteriales bacterium]